ncbi:hypothetical protein VTH06DRAFT_5888 [Thermothelomyces fergusii]
MRSSDEKAQANQPPSPCHDSGSSEGGKDASLMPGFPETPTPAPRAGRPAVDNARVGPHDLSPVGGARQTGPETPVPPRAQQRGADAAVFARAIGPPRCFDRLPQASVLVWMVHYVSADTRVVPSLGFPGGRGDGRAGSDAGVGAPDWLTAPGWQEDGGAAREGPSPVPEKSPFVVREGAGSVQRLGPFAGRPPTPPRPARLVAPLPSSDGYAVPPSRGWVESTVIDQSNPYAAFLRANGKVLAVNASRGAGLVLRVETADGGEGEAAGETRDEAHHATMADPAYLPPGLPRPGNHGNRLMARRARPLPRYAPASASRRGQP